jgi:site-specific DNA recombinase
VRRIFAEYVSGSSIRQIIRRLYEDKVPTATGKAMWQPAMLSGLLNNPTYMGKASWYRTMHVTPPGGGATIRRRRPENEWVEVIVPAIVSEETYAAAQAARANHSTFSPRRATPGEWLLRYLVICGPCGAHTRAQKMTSSTGKASFYYSCSHHDVVVAGGPDKLCREQRIRAAGLDAFVWDQVRDVLLRPEILLAGEAALAGRDIGDDEILDAQVQRLARRLEQTDAERRRLADLYQAEHITLDELRHRGAEVAARRTALQGEHAELAARHQELAGKNRLRDRLTDFAATVAGGLDNLDLDGRQQLLRLLIEQVRVTGSQVEIRLRIPLGGEPVDGDSDRPPRPNSSTPTPKSRQRRGATNPVSTEERLRSVDHPLPQALRRPRGLPLADVRRRGRLSQLHRERSDSPWACRDLSLTL